MSGAGMLWRKPSQTHEFIGSAEIHLFTELFLNPLLEHFAIPDDALIKIVSQVDSKLLLFIWTQHRGCALVVRPAIP
ncbi:hypothetical protein DESA109040_22990 [Deinococcus saxicola]